MKEGVVYGVFKVPNTHYSFFVTTKSIGVICQGGFKDIISPGVHKSNIPDSWKQIVHEELVEW